MKSWYYYLHTNGCLIGKNPVVVESDPYYFNSDFVVKYWKVTSRREIVNMVVEARELGGRWDRIQAVLDEKGVTEKEYRDFLYEITEDKVLERKVKGRRK